MIVRWLRSQGDKNNNLGLLTFCNVEFDEGHLSKDPALAQEEIDRNLEIMEDTQAPVQVEDNAIRYMFQTTWDRLKKVLLITLPRTPSVVHKLI